MRKYSRYKYYVNVTTFFGTKAHHFYTKTAATKFAAKQRKRLLLAKVSIHKH